jgi:hypothetical protein
MNPSLMFAILVSFMVQSAFANRVSSSEYNYPALTPNLSTFYSACLGAVEKGEDVAVTILNRRVEGYRKYRSLKLKLYRAEVSAPVVFILSGFGGDEESNVSRYLAVRIQKMGFNALIVPNTMTPNFVVSSSPSGLVGLTNEDAKDLYAALAQTSAELVGQGLTSRERYLLGYSHGALLASYISVLDLEQKRLNFKSSLLINPPVDLLHSLKLLDQKAMQFKDISLGRLLDFATDLQGKVKRCAKTPAEALQPEEFVNGLELKDSEAAGLIGMVFLGTLKDLILATEAIQDHDILPLPGMPGSVGERAQNSARKRAASRIGFQEYVESILLPFHKAVQKTMGLSELSAETSLPFALNKLSGQQNIFLMHNADDFLLRSEDLVYLESYFGHRARIYPYGGHLGNLGHADNVRAIENWLKKGQIN